MKKLGLKTEFLQPRPTTERNKKRQRTTKKEREREIVHQLARIPIYFKKPRGG